jgi:hypothetical protein
MVTQAVQVAHIQAVVVVVVVVQEVLVKHLMLVVLAVLEGQTLYQVAL